jgi:hypothetical protein
MYLIYLYLFVSNFLIYYIFFYEHPTTLPYKIKGDYIYQNDPINKGEYSRFNYKTKECVNWISKTICNDILFSCKKLKPKILVLGVALGDMIIHLSNKRIDFIITGVDISDINYDIVKKYSNTTNVKLIKESAESFIKNSNEVYDYIICDIFNSVNIPSFVFTYKFLSKINQMILHNGKFLINIVVIEDIKEHKVKTIFEEIFTYNNINIKTNNDNLLMIINK